MEVIVYQPGEGPSWEEIPPDWKGFRLWRYSNPGYLSLMDNHPGRIQALENSLSQEDYESAIAVWSGLISSGAVSPELKTELYNAALLYALPNPVLQALEAL